MNKLNVILLLLLWGFLVGFSRQKNEYIDPTGTYELDGKTIMKDGDQYGYFGEIQVKTIAKDRIAMSFYICKGAPSYNSGSFFDTLIYNENVAVYKDSLSESKCTTTFVFTKKGIDISEKANYKYGSCWGAGVVANGHFKKTSSKVPILKHMLSGTYY